MGHETFLVCRTRAVGFDPRAAGNQTKGGVATILAAGYRAFGFWGDFPMFHTPQDLATSTSGELMAPVVAALVQALRNIESELVETVMVRGDDQAHG